MLVVQAISLLFGVAFALLGAAFIRWNWSLRGPKKNWYRDFRHQCRLPSPNVSICWRERQAAVPLHCSTIGSPAFIAPRLCLLRRSEPTPVFGRTSINGKTIGHHVIFDDLSRDRVDPTVRTMA